MGPETDLYDPGDLGPYRVVIKNENTTNNFIDAMRIGQILTKSEINNITSIRKQTRSSVTVTFSNSEEANKLVNNEELKNKYKIFIPKSFIYVFGYIKGIDMEMEMEGKHGLKNEIQKITLTQ